MFLLLSLMLFSFASTEKCERTLTNYFKQGFDYFDSYLACKNIYRTICKNYPSTLDNNETKAFYWLNSETQSLYHVIDNISKILDDYLGQKRNFDELSDAEKVFLQDYRLLLRDLAGERMMSQDDSMSLGASPMSRSRFSFGDPKLVAYDVLKPLPLHQQAAYINMEQNSIPATVLFVNRQIGWQRAINLRTRAEELIPPIRDAVVSMLLNAHWLNFTVKKDLVQSVREVKLVVGFGDWLMDEQKINSCLHGRPAFCQQRTLSTFGISYNSETNTILVPFISILPPLFHANYTDAAKFGILGYKIASALFEFLFTEGHIHVKGTDCISGVLARFCDLNGNCMETSRWGARETKLFAKFLGLKAAFLAFQNVLLETPESPMKSKFLQSFSPEQLFFISYIRSRCTVISPKIFDYFYGTHHQFFGMMTPPSLEVLANFYLSPEMRSAFSCTATKHTDSCEL